ncbi:hypothetical protein CDAR_267691 [Caerostris darwini]|uniref:Uncharacterized protein n=1 Tax=Caerostris darwini TaxID=1538125 RepID=A0AAV4U497_9ARAC|nr:hypothetical protein CDAR_267691 [Caerostris darwini]
MKNAGLVKETERRWEAARMMHPSTATPGSGVAACSKKILTKGRALDHRPFRSHKKQNRYGPILAVCGHREKSLKEYPLSVTLKFFELPNFLIP